jgi:membrane associated rhomboid family serine protease
MIPLRDVIPSPTAPIVTVAILTINTVAFVYERRLSPHELEAFVAEFGLVPGSVRWTAVMTSMFLHGSWLQFLINMLCLWIFGGTIEDRLSHGRFLAFYLLCGCAAALAQAATTPFTYLPMVGAGGAIAGIIGAYFLLFSRSRILVLVPLVLSWDVVEVPAVFFLGLWLMVQLVSGVGFFGARTQDIGGIAYWAHLAGFVTGAGGMLLFRRRDRQRVEWWSA